MPGENRFIDEFARSHKIPRATALGGPETMYPEFSAVR